jgi:regulator of sigma E protease
MTAEQIVVFLLLLSTLVVLHEYGHFIVARLNGVRVTDFAVGFGPTLLRWTSPRSGTNYRLNLLPLGGYCQMKGEDGRSNEAEQQREFRAGEVFEHDNFQAKAPLKRLLIIVAGPAVNFIVAFAILIGAAVAIGGPGYTTELGALRPNYPAQRAGMRQGDMIRSVNGEALDGGQLIAIIHASAGKRLHIVYSRGNTLHEVDVTPTAQSLNGRPREGLLGFAPVVIVQRLGLVEATEQSFAECTTIVASTLGALGGLFTHPAEVAAQMQGPIGLARASAAMESRGLYAFLNLAAVISLSLGIFNLLPIPALDGGRASFIVVEALRGRPMDPQKEALVHVGGLAVLVAILIAVSFHDVKQALAGSAPF